MIKAIITLSIILNVIFLFFLNKKKIKKIIFKNKIKEVDIFQVHKIFESEKISSNLIGPKKDVIIKIHFLLLMDSPINIELKIIARGIDSCAPITRGDKILDALTDKYKNKLTPAPIEKAKPNKGNKYFLFGSLNFIKGNKQINTIIILKAPNNIGGIDALIPSFAVG